MKLLDLSDAMAGADLDNFLVLSHAPDDSKLNWLWLDTSERLAPRALNELMDGTLTPERPVPFRVMKGRRRPDVFGTSSAVPVFSGQLVRALKKIGCKGLDAYPAVLY